MYRCAGSILYTLVWRSVIWIYSSKLIHEREIEIIEPELLKTSWIQNQLNLTPKIIYQCFYLPKSNCFRSSSNKLAASFLMDFLSRTELKYKLHYYSYFYNSQDIESHLKTIKTARQSLFKVERISIKPKHQNKNCL